MNKSVYEFRVAFQSEDELKTLQEAPTADPSTLVKSTLPNGLPSFKTIYTLAGSEEEAITRVDAYVARTPYKDIHDNKII